MARCELDTRAFKCGRTITTIGVEKEFWDSLELIAQREVRPVEVILSDIDAVRKEISRASAVRTFVARYFLEHVSGSGVFPIPVLDSADPVAHGSQSAKV